MVEETKQTISLLDQIKVVAEARSNAKAYNEEKKKIYEEVEEKHASLFADAFNANQIVGEAETLLRELTIKAYNETGSKQPALGVNIRETTKLNYDPKEALKWAMEHQIALSLDKKSFEGFAKATPLDFVEVTTEAQATIATDLNKVLEGINDSNNQPGK